MKKTTLLALPAIAGVTVAALVGCSNAGASSSASNTDSGIVRVAVLGSPTDTLDITQAVTNMPFAVDYNVYDSLVMLEGGEIVHQLAESLTPNADATEWTIVIHGDVMFHDGTPLTADDVLYSLRYQGTSPAYSSIYADVDFDASTSDGDRTVVLKTTRPRADLVEGILAQVNLVFPDGTTDFSDGNGSGPFKVESFSADTGTVLVRNDDYWGGAPTLEQIEFVPIADASARLSALTDGQVDLALGITAAGADSVESNSDLTVVDDGVRASSAFLFTVNTTIAPFDDPEVREAFKLAIDRQQLVDTVFRGRGEVGNDIVGAGLPGYDEDLAQREHDPELAEKIFAEHGVTDLGIVAAELTPGILDATEMVKQQLADIGVTLTITEADPTAIYTDLEQVQRSQMFATYLINRPVASTLPTFTSKESVYNFSGWADEEYNQLLIDSQRAVDEGERQTLLDAAQQRMWDEGGDVVWGFQSELFAHVSGLEGIEISQSMPLFHDAGYEE